MDTNSNRRVSVVMTAYNAERFIREAIESILNQTFKNFELIVIDDASSDCTAEIAESFDDPRIRVIRNRENMGISRTRNKGIALARGEYLAAMDHDDISLPERLEKEVAFLDSHPDHVLVATAARHLEGSKITDYYTPITKPHVLNFALFTQCPLIHSSICIRASTLREHNLEYRAEYRYAEDFDLYHQLAKVGKLVCLPNRLTIYRTHGDNTSNVRNDEMSANGCRFMIDTYRELLGPDVASSDMERIWSAVTHGHAEKTREGLLGVGSMLVRLLKSFMDAKELNAGQRDDVAEYASGVWWTVVARAARVQGPRAISCYKLFPELSQKPVAPRDQFMTLMVAVLGPFIFDRAKSIIKVVPLKKP